MSLHLKSVHVWCACQNYADLLGIRNEGGEGDKEAKQLQSYLMYGPL